MGKLLTKPSTRLQRAVMEVVDKERVKQLTGKLISHDIETTPDGKKIFSMKAELASTPKISSSGKNNLYVYTGAMTLVDSIEDKNLVVKVEVATNN